VPVDDAHPVVIVGTLGHDGGPEVPADTLAELLTQLPVTTRSQIRLAPVRPSRPADV
jgi:hypothetical protein